MRIVDAKLEGRRAVGTGDQLESANRDQQALRGNSVSDDDADQRSPEPLRLAEFNHPAADPQSHQLEAPEVEVNMQSLRAHERASAGL